MKEIVFWDICMWLKEPKKIHCHSLWKLIFFFYIMSLISMSKKMIKLCCSTNFKIFLYYPFKELRSPKMFDYCQSCLSLLTLILFKFQIHLFKNFWKWDIFWLARHQCLHIISMHTCMYNLYRCVEWIYVCIYV